MEVMGKYKTKPSRWMRISPGSLPKNGSFPIRARPKMTSTIPMMTKAFPNPENSGITIPAIMIARKEGV